MVYYSPGKFLNQDFTNQNTLLPDTYPQFRVVRNAITYNYFHSIHTYLSDYQTLGFLKKKIIHSHGFIASKAYLGMIKRLLFPLSFIRIPGSLLIQKNGPSSRMNGRSPI